MIAAKLTNDVIKQMERVLITTAVSVTYKKKKKKGAAMKYQNVWYSPEWKVEREGTFLGNTSEFGKSLRAAPAADPADGVPAPPATPAPPTPPGPPTPPTDTGQFTLRTGKHDTDCITIIIHLLKSKWNDKKKTGVCVCLRPRSLLKR